MDEREAFAGRLMGGETMVWTGRPRQGLMFQPMDIVLIPATLLWAGMFFGVFRADGGGLRGGLTNAPLPFSLFPLIFGLVGAYVLVGRYIHDAWIRSRTYYALTSRRALILRGGSLTAIDLANTTTVRVKGGTDRGTIYFNDDGDMAGLFRNRGWGVWVPSMVGTRFLGIEDAQRVFNQIEMIRAKAG
jgi:hypothetical protein